MYISTLVENLAYVLVWVFVLLKIAYVSSMAVSIWTISMLSLSWFHHILYNSHLYLHRPHEHYHSEHITSSTYLTRNMMFVHDKSWFNNIKACHRCVPSHYLNKKRSYSSLHMCITTPSWLMPNVIRTPISILFCRHCFSLDIRFAHKCKCYW